MNKSKILFIVEGERLEKDVFSEIAKIYNLKYEIFCLRCNIYMLYNIMKEYDFNVSIKDILIKKLIKGINDEEIDIIKSNKFAYTYIILDLDLQHYSNDIEKALVQIEEMCEYFIDETDDTIGKLYINYPMMESFRDRDSFEDDKYNDKIVRINEIKNYKEIVGKCKLSSIHINKYGKEGFDQIIKSNIKKASEKLFDYKNISYNEYLFNITTPKIFNKQKYNINKGYVSILNTSLHFVVDYLGKKYFEKILGYKK